MVRYLRAYACGKICEKEFQNLTGFVNPLHVVRCCLHSGICKTDEVFPELHVKKESLQHEIRLT